MDPDTTIRRKIYLNSNDHLLGTKVNYHIPPEFNVCLKQMGGVHIRSWGANPAIFSREAWLSAYTKLQTVGTEFFLDQMSNTFYAIYAYDLLIPTILSLCGVSETKTALIVETKRNRLWRLSRAPIVHQYRKYI